jgi:hypothetical protein
VPRNAARAVAHQITAEWGGQQVAKAGCDCKVALVHRVQLFGKELPRDGRRHYDGIGQGQWDLRQHGVRCAVHDISPARQNQVREMQSEIQSRERRRN